MRDHKVIPLLKRHPHLWSYLLFVLVVLYGFWRIDQNTKEVCYTAQHTREATFQVVESVTNTVTTNIQQTPEQRLAITNTNAARTEARENARSILLGQAPPCG